MSAYGFEGHRPEGHVLEGHGQGAHRGQPVPVQTVTGPVPSDQLGLTLPHEHLANDLRTAVTAPRRPEHAFLARAEVTPELAWLLREEPYACEDHCVLDVPDTIVEDLREFARIGGGTVVELTPPGLGRSPATLLEISERSGVKVVMGSGWYLEPFHPEDIAGRGEEELAASLLQEFRAGAGPRPGVIGEIGVSPDFTAAERRCLRAACLAQRELAAEGRGVPLFVHLPGWQRRGAEVLDIVVEEQGVDPGAVVLCHMDPSGEDPAYQREMAERGVWIEFDMIGMPFLYPSEGQSPSPAQTAEAIVRLAGGGHADRLLLSHDVFLKSMLTAFGGNGFGYVPALFAQRLAERGLDPEVVRSLMTENPRRLFETAACAMQQTDPQT